LQGHKITCQCCIEYIVTHFFYATICYHRSMADFHFKIVADEDGLAGAFSVRRLVFVREQGIPEELVYDGCDGEAMNIVAYRGDSIIGTARVRFTGDGEAKLERMAVLPSYRSQGIGRELLSFVIERLKEEAVNRLVLHAQHEAAGFYRKCGFEATGSLFSEAGMEHIKMERRL